MCDVNRPLIPSLPLPSHSHHPPAKNKKFKKVNTFQKGIANLCVHAKEEENQS